MISSKHVLATAVGCALAISVAAGTPFVPVAPAGALSTCTKSWANPGTSGHWAVAANWAGSVLPQATDDVCLPASGTAYTVDIDETPDNAASLDIGAGATLLLKGSAFTSALFVTNGVTNAGTIQFGSGLSHPQPITLSAATVTNTGLIVTTGSGTNNLTASIANQATGTINLAAASGGLSVSKSGATHSNAGTWTVNAQNDIDLATSFTMTAGTLSGAALFHLVGATFDHTGGTISLLSGAEIDNGTLKPRVAGGGTGNFLLVKTNTLASDVAAGETLTLTGGFTSADALLQSSASRVNNGTILMTTNNNSNTAKIVFDSGATLTNAGTLTTTAPVSGGGSSSGARVLGLPLINQGTFNVSYATVFTLPAATITQSAGTTNLSRNLDMTGSAATFTLNGGTLRGIGSLIGSLANVGGTVAPGTAPGSSGIITVGGYTQAAGGTLDIEIGGTDIGGTNDRLAVTGTADLGGTLALSTIDSFAPPLTFNYDFITYSNLSGSFGSTTGTSLGGGKSFFVTLNTTAGNLTVTAPSVTRKPDGQIAIGSGTFVGNNIYNADGTSQTKSKTAGAGTTVTFKVRLQNDGTGASDKFIVHATGANTTGYTIKYKKGTTNITTAVVNGTYTTANIAVGSSLTIKVVVTIGSSAGHGSSVSRLVTITSFNDSGQKDAVKATVGRT